MPRMYVLLVLLGTGTGLRQGEPFGLAADRIMMASVNRVARTYEPVLLQACDAGRVDSSASRKSQ